MLSLIVALAQATQPAGAPATEPITLGSIIVLGLTVIRAGEKFLDKWLEVRAEKKGKKCPDEKSRTGIPDPEFRLCSQEVAKALQQSADLQKQGIVATNALGTQMASLTTAIAKGFENTDLRLKHLEN